MSTKHGFNEFREGRAFALADRAVASLAHVHIAISQGLAHYLSRPRGSTRTASRSSTTASRRGRGRAVRGLGAETALRRPADPDQGPHRPPAGIRRGAQRGARPAARHRGPRAARAGAARARARAGRRGRACASSATSPRSRGRSRTRRSSSCPSMGEGFGMVALEAMERSRPVIAAEIGGLGELVVDGETGLLVEPGVAEPLARAIVELAGDLDRAAEMGRAGRRTGAGGVPRVALRRADGAALRAMRSPRAERARTRPASAPPCRRPRTRSARARARRGPSSPLGPGRRAACRPPPRARTRRRPARARRSHRRPRAREPSPPARRRPASLPASPRASRARIPPSARGGHDVGVAVERRDVTDPAGSRSRSRTPSEPASVSSATRSGPSPSTSSVASGRSGERAHGRLEPLLRRESAYGEEQRLAEGRAAGSRSRLRVARRARSARRRPSPAAGRPGRR